MKIEGWIEKPKDWREAGHNYELMQKHYAKIIDELQKKFPEQRGQALSELKPIIGELKLLRAKLEGFDATWFTDKTNDNKIRPLGMVGRSVLTDLFAVPELDRVIAILEKVAKSLEG